MFVAGTKETVAGLNGTDEDHRRGGRSVGRRDNDCAGYRTIITHRNQCCCCIVVRTGASSFPYVFVIGFERKGDTDRYTRTSTHTQARAHRGELSDRVGH